MNYAMGNSPTSGGGYSQSTAPLAEPKTPSPEVMERWKRDMITMEESIGLMLGNRLQEAEDRLEAASQEVSERKIDFAAGDHDLRGAFTFVSALMSLINGLATLENNQLDTVLERVWAADEQLVLDGDWPGKAVLRGLCNLVAGVVEIMQGMPSKGVWHVLRSWYWLRNLESEGLNYEGHEKTCVRSTALLGLGIFNLFVSMLPPTAMKAAGWATGFCGGRDVALQQLRMCFEEGGLQAPFAGLVLIGFAVDVSSFLGELRAEREERHKEARQILDWANERYADAFFFAGLESGYLAATCDLEGALEKLDLARASVENLPAFLFLVNVRKATFLLSLFRWKDAGDAFASAVEVYRGVGRRALCPSLSLNSHLCYVRAGLQDRAAEMLSLCRSYSKEKKKWSPLDRTSLQQAEAAFAEAQTSPSSVNDFLAGPEASPEASAEDEEASAASDHKKIVWRPTMLLYMKICLVYRGVNFMKPDQAEEFLALVRAETEEQKDLDGKLLGLCIQAEGLRQRERWKEALSKALKGVALEPGVSKEGLKSGAIHFCHLVSAYSYYAQGQPVAASEALSSLSRLGNSQHFFQKQVEFKATHLRRLVGADFEESYREVSVPARSKARLIIDLPEGDSHLQWDWVLEGFSIDFDAEFYPAKGSEPLKLLSVAQHPAESGPSEGSAGPLGPGRVELVFSNSFSMLRAKTLQCRVQPSSLKVTQEAR